MNTSKYIAQTIDRLAKGCVFTYTDFISEVHGKEAVIKALNRMAASGTIEKTAKGKFYKPERSPFGNLQPNRYQIVKDLLESNGKVTGYLTGYSIYNTLGLTTRHYTRITDDMMSKAVKNIEKGNIRATTSSKVSLEAV